MYRPESQPVIALEHCRSALLQRLTGMAKSEDSKLRQQLQTQLERVSWNLVINRYRYILL